MKFINMFARLNQRILPDTANALPTALSHEIELGRMLARGCDKQRFLQRR